MAFTGETDASIRFIAPDVSADITLGFSVTVSDGVNVVTQSSQVALIWIPQELSISAITTTSSINEGA